MTAGMNLAALMLGREKVFVCWITDVRRPETSCDETTLVPER